MLASEPNQNITNIQHEEMSLAALNQSLRSAGQDEVFCVVRLKQELQDTRQELHQSEQSFDYGRKQYEYSYKEVEDMRSQIQALMISNDKTAQEQKHR